MKRTPTKKQPDTGSTPPLRVVAVSDMHVGSRWALSHPDGDARQTSTRAGIFAHWANATLGKWGQPDVMLLCGDLIEGQNRKGSGTGTWTNELEEQIDQAVELIEMWRAKEIYVIRGSCYHVDAGNSGLECEELIAERLGAHQWQVGADVDGHPVYQRSVYHGYVDLRGVVFHLQHWIGVSKTYAYQSTPTAKEMLWTMLNTIATNEGGERVKVDVNIRAHAHYYNEVHYSGSMGIVLPCWKGQDVYMQRKGALHIKSDLGFVGFEINGPGDFVRSKNLFTLRDIQDPPTAVVR